MNPSNTSSIVASDKKKPKFQPKLKKFEPEVELQSDPIPIKQETQKKPSNPSNNQGKAREFRPRDHGGRDFNRGRSSMDGRGRGRSIAPVGTAFFRGNTSNTAPPKFSFVSNPTNQISIKAERYDDKEISSKQETTSSGSKLKIKEASERPFGRNVIQSDDEDDDYMIKDDEENIKEEVWPPTDINPFAPLELPIGPSTVAARVAFDSKPIFASLDDAAALEQEATVEMFLMQLPSDIRMPKPGIKTEDMVGGDKQQSNNLRGKIGKIIILKSGKVYLVGADGRKYFLSPGMTCTFAQYAAAISVERPVVNIPEDSASSSAGKDIKPVPAIDPTDPSKMKGTCHLLGSISRKIIVVPEYEIGSRKWEEDEEVVNMPSKPTKTNAKVSGRPERSNSISTEISETDYDAKYGNMPMDYASDNEG